MRKLIAYAILSCLLCGGCHWFIDARAKRAVSIVSAEAQVALEKAPASERETECYRSMTRIAPALQSLNSYVWGREPMKEASGSSGTGGKQP